MADWFIATEGVKVVSGTSNHHGSNVDWRGSRGRRADALLHPQA